MARLPDNVARFLSGHRFAVAGVSRTPGQAANAVYRKLLASGYEVYAINPNAAEVEGVQAYPNLRAIGAALEGAALEGAALEGAALDGLVVATHPKFALELIRQCADLSVPMVWFHRSFGEGSVCEDAVLECGRHGIECIVGGCPLMFLEPVDLGHRCMCWWLQRQGRVPR